MHEDRREAMKVPLRISDVTLRKSHIVISKIRPLLGAPIGIALGSVLASPISGNPRIPLRLDHEPVTIWAAVTAPTCKSPQHKHGCEARRNT